MAILSQWNNLDLSLSKVFSLGYAALKDEQLEATVTFVQADANELLLVLL